MKKILKKVCGLLSFAIALNTLTSGVNSSTSVVNAVGTIKGDVNCDGIVSGVDALSMRKYLLGQDELDHRAQMNSDIDGNGKINIVDMILITEMLISNTGETTTTTTSESDNTVITTSDQTVTSEVTTAMSEQETQPLTTTAPDQTTEEVTTTPKQTTTKVTTTPTQTTTAKVTTTPKQIPADTPNPLDDKLKASIFKLVNEEREKNGSKPVNLDITLSYVADIRAAELSDFFDIDRPDGSSYKSLLREYGLNFFNIHHYVMAGHTSALSVSNVMLKRGAFLDNCFTKIGIGYYDDGGYFAIIFT